MPKTIVTIFVYMYLMITSLAFGQQNGQLEAKADSLFQHFEEEQALDVYRKVLEQNPEDYEALWKTSLLYSRVGNRFDEKEKQEEYFNKAIDLAERALKFDSTDTQSNFVMSVAMGRKALISGARDRVAASRAIKKYVDKAIKYDSTNAGAWHVLGRWHFKVANLNFFERLAAKALFGGIPGDASNEKAEEAIQKAIDLNSSYILYFYDLAQVYEEMGQKQRAIQVCKTALQKDILMPDDPKLKEDCQTLINKLD